MLHYLKYYSIDKNHKSMQNIVLEYFCLIILKCMRYAYVYILSTYYQRLVPFVLFGSGCGLVLN